MAIPTSDEVRGYAESLGMTVDDYDFTGEIAEAVAAFESGTNRYGFFASSAGTFTGDGPDWRSEDVWWIPDHSAITAVSYDGRTLTAGTDYRLLRWRRGDTTTPYVAVQFLRCPGGEIDKYEIAGTRGYGTTPADVTHAVTRRALAIYLGAPINGAPGPIRSEKLGAQDVEYDLTAGRDAVSRAVADFASCVSRYTRWT